MGDMTQDIDLRDRVLDQLGWERSVDASAINVSVKDGYVTLSGRVASFEERSAAERAAGQVEGVKGVDSEIVVQLPPPKIIS
jgi:osmotically-inducible protein OsmY